MLEIKNVVVVVVFIFLDHNGLCGILADVLGHLHTPYMHGCNSEGNL